MNTNDLNDTHPALWLLIELIGVSAVVASFAFSYIRSQTYGNPDYTISIVAAVVLGGAILFRRSMAKRERRP